MKVVDQLLTGARGEEEIVGPGGVLAQLTERLVERALQAELTEHLGYEPHQESPGGAGNTRNGSTPKTLATEHGPVRVETPRDRGAASSRSWSGRGSGASRASTTRSLPSTRAASRRATSKRTWPRSTASRSAATCLISRVTDAVMDDVREWRQRPLEDVYPVIFLDAPMLKVREGGTVQRRACYRVLGVTVEGERDVLGMWFQESEGAKFWMQVLSELK